MKRMIVISLLTFVLAGCGSSYDKGYDDGYDGAQKSAFSAFNKDYRQGYEDGQNDAYYFNLGCRDKANEEPPAHTNIAEYMKGYNEC